MPSPLPALQADFIDQIRSRYAQASPEPLSKQDIERWNEIVGSTTRQAYDTMARLLAVAFYEGRLPFWFCDYVMNGFWGYVFNFAMPDEPDAWPAFFYDVYQAFDAGEYSPSGIDPIEACTRPMIAEILADHPE